MSIQLTPIGTRQTALYKTQGRAQEKQGSSSLPTRLSPHRAFVARPAPIQLRQAAHTHNPPDGQTIGVGDRGGRPSRITTPSGAHTYGYDSAGRVEGISAPGGLALGYTYDGSLPLRTTWSRAINASVSRTFDSNFRVVSESVNGGSTVGFTYDNDGLLTGAGGFNLARDPQNGLLTGTTLGSVADSWTCNSFGEPVGYEATVSGNSFYSATYTTRDRVGRITDKSETVGGATDPYHYA